MTRRTALLATGTLLGGIPATASAIRTAPSAPSSVTAATPTATFELGADFEGWMGQSPGSIEDVTNPTLSMIPGETYEVIYENLDGITHDFQILDDEGSVLINGGDVSNSGDTNSVQFTATEEMTDYRCHYHPSSMAGSVETDATTPTPTPTDTPTSTPSPTMKPTDTPTATPRDAPTATAAGTETPTDTSTPTDDSTATGTTMTTATPTEQATGTGTPAETETTTVSSPGLGIGAATAALLARIAVELRSD